MSNENTNWGQSVTGVVIKEGKVLLARHTYGGGNGKLIVPGGYVEHGETPQHALVREYLEETGITIEPVNIIGIPAKKVWGVWRILALKNFRNGFSTQMKTPDSRKEGMIMDNSIARNLYESFGNNYT